MGKTGLTGETIKLLIKKGFTVKNDGRNGYHLYATDGTKLGYGPYHTYEGAWASWNWDNFLGSGWDKDVQPVIAGVGKDAPIVTNEKGAKQSATPYRLDLLPPHATLAVAKVLAEGAEKYGEWNWLNIETNSNLNHALQHVFAYLAGDTSDDHLEHAACRMLMALEIAKRKGDVECDPM